MWLLEETITRPDLNDMYWAKNGIEPKSEMRKIADENHIVWTDDNLKQYENYLKGSVTHS